MARWSVVVPSKFSEQSLTQWAEKQIASGVPRQILSHHLLSHDINGHLNIMAEIEERQAISSVWDKIFGVMVDRNLKGKALEKEGRVDEAIALYEQNVEDWFEGGHPYDRLRIIYTKRGRVADAIRVCDAFVAVTDELIALGVRRSDSYHLAKRQKFAKWAEKLTAKQA